MIIKIIAGILVGMSAYFILADILKLPYIRTSKAVNNLSKAQREKTSSIDVWLGSLASTIAKHLPMNEFKKQELETDLRTAQMDITPQMYMANAVVKSMLIAVFAVPMVFIFPILVPIILFLAFMLYRINVKSVGNRIKIKREKIENSLPRLVGTIQKTLTRSRSIVVCDLSKSDITVQSGAMQWSAGNVNATTGIKGVGDFFGKAIRGKVTGESAIKPEYTGNGTLVLEPTYKHALLFLRGERPIQDFKYNILKHPNVSLTTDGKEKPYIHGFSDYSLGELCYENSTPTKENEKNESMDNIDFVIYSSEEIEDFLRDNEEEKSNEKI